MGIQVTGKLHAVFETKQVTARFTKREFVIEIADGKYPQLVLFQLTGDRCDQLDRVAIGDEVRVDFSLRGREWRSPQGEVKYFNSLDAWTIEAASAGAGTRRGAPQQAQRGGGGGGGDHGRGGGGGSSSGGGRRNDAPPPRDDDAPPPRDEDFRGGGNSNDVDDLPF